MSLIKEALLDLQQLTFDAGQPLQNIPTAIRAGVEGRIRAAQAKLPAAKERYQKLVVENAVFIPLTGDAAEEFALTAQAEFGAFAADYNKLPTQVFESIDKRSFGKVYSSNTHGALLTELGGIKTQLGIQKLPPLQFYNGSQNTDVKAIIKQQFDEFYEGQLNILSIKKELGEYALSEGFEGGSLPVILYNIEGTPYAKHLKTLNELRIDKKEKDHKITSSEVQQVLSQLKKANV